MTPNPTKTPQALGPDDVIGNYRILKEIGRGGMGVVYLVEHTTLQSKAALKTLLPNKQTTKVDIERFLREAQTAHKIRHENVIYVRDAGKMDEYYYLVMDYVDGSDLAKHVAHRGPMPWTQALKVARAVASGANAIHANGCIHRDIKPANIIATQDLSKIILMDLGLLREETGADLTNPDTIVGTPAYMSPEQCRGLNLDARSDIYSLGGTLYFLLTGETPYKGDPLHLVIAKISGGIPPRAMREIVPNIPNSVQDFVLRSMVFKRENRIQTCADFQTASDALMPTKDTISVSDKLVDTNRGKITPIKPRAAQLPANPPMNKPHPPPIPMSPRPEAHPTSPVAEVELLPEVQPILPAPWWKNPFDHLLKNTKSKISAAIAMLLLFCLGGYVLTRGWSDEQERKKLQNIHLSADMGNNKIDTARMVFVPAGIVRVGNHESKIRPYLLTLAPIQQNPALLDECLANMDPTATENVSAFWIDRYEVTNAEYALFLQATKHPAPAHWNNEHPPQGQENSPVTNILRSDAEAFATWANKKLPTLTQWVRACRMDQNWLFPWGDTWEPERCNVDENKLLAGSAPVTATPQDISNVGVCNLVGNVREFLRDTIVDQEGTWALVKGCDAHSSGCLYGLIDYRIRATSDVRREGIGFRCVVEATR